MKTYLIVIPSSLSFPGHGHFNLLLHYRLELADEADMSQTLLHDHGDGFCATLSTFVHSILQ